MKNIIAIAALVFAAQSVQAAGFSPWETDGPINDRIDTTAASVEAAGFGPWRDREVQADVSNTQFAVEVGVNANQQHVFRPWS